MLKIKEKIQLGIHRLIKSQNLKNSSRYIEGCFLSCLERRKKKNFGGQTAAEKLKKKQIAS